MLPLTDHGAEAAIARERRSRGLLPVSGKPIGSPVAWYGPIVMNTRAELRVAFGEYEKGTFSKHR